MNIIVGSKPVDARQAPSMTLRRQPGADTNAGIARLSRIYRRVHIRPELPTGSITERTDLRAKRERVRVESDDEITAVTNIPRNLRRNCP